MSDDKKPPKSSIDILILILGVTVAFYIIGATIFVGIIKINDPDANVNAATTSLTSMITGVLGALLGLLAGKGGDSK